MQSHPQAYTGSESHIFVCYAHADADDVYAEIAALQAEGFRVWFDEGITPATEWSDTIAAAIKNCSAFVYFVSPRSVSSEHCRREVSFAIDNDRAVLSVYLEDTQIPDGLQLSLGNRQSILRSELEGGEYHTKLNSTVEQLLAGGSSVLATGNRQDQQRKAARRWPVATYAVAALALLSLGAILTRDYWQAESNPSTRSTAAADEQSALASKDIPHQSVAVLPFLNMSGDAQNEYFSDGLTETLLHMLAQLPDLLVSARTSSFAFKGQNVDIREIAFALGVAHILEGSVQKAKNRVRVTAQLIRAADGFHVWSQNYDRTLDDIFAIQDEIAIDVASALGSSLLTADAGNIQGVSTADTSAFDLYLQGLEQQAINTNDSLAKAVDLFEAALAQDSEFTDATIALVRNHFFLRWRLGDLSPYSVDDTAVLVADVLAREPDHLAAQGLSLMVQINQAGKRMDLHVQDDLIEQTVALMARGFGDSYVRRVIVQNLGFRERRDEALAILREGLMTDPLNYDLLWAQATLFTQMERHLDAVASLLKARKLAPDNPLVLWKLGVTSFDAGNVVEGLDWIRQCGELDLGDPVPSAILAQRFYALDLPQAGDHWRRRSLEDDPDRLAFVLNLAAAQARGDDDERLMLALQAIDEGLENDTIPVGLATWHYAIVMHKRGQSREALDFLISKVPQLADLAWNPTDWKLWNLKAYSFNLWADVLEPSEFVRHAKAFVQTTEASNIKFTGDHAVEITLAIWQEDLEAAKTNLLQDMRDYPVDQGHWDAIMESPWLEEFRRDPDVAARLAETAIARERLRGEVQQMLLRPEWQFDQ